MRAHWFLAAVATSLVLALPAAAQSDKPAPPVKAVGTIELSDPAGDVNPIHTSGDADYPPMDVVKLSIKSDGKQITVGATLKDPPGAFASSVVELYFDTDNNPATGAQFTFPKIGGFEYRSELDACVDYADKSSACAGGSKSKPTAHYAEALLDVYTGKGQYDKKTLIDFAAFSGTTRADKYPISGTLVEAKLSYEALKVKPGQTIRIVAKEGHAKDSGLFPDVLLTLK